MRKVMTALLLALMFGAAGTRASDSDPYPLRVASDHRHLVDQAGAPFLIQGDAAWSLISGLTKEEAERYLEDRRQKGFNSIIVNLIEHKFRGPANRYGQGPFVVPGDFSAPNERYFEHADWVLRKAAEKGIQVFLAPVYLGYLGTDEGWIEEVRKNGPEKCRNWGRFVGKRYAGFNNLVWMIGGDRNPDTVHEDMNEVVKGIKEFDQRHVFTAHCHPENSAVDQYGRDGWLDLNTTYTYEIVHSKLLSDYHRSPVMPFVLIESTYEGEHNASAVQIRRQAYWALLSGAAGQFLGNRPIWLFDPGWEAAINSTGNQDMVRLKALFTSRSWNTLVPDDQHEVVTEGLGEFTGLDYLAAARTGDGGTLIAYMPTPRTITVDLAKMSGKQVLVTWFNPRTGKTETGGEFLTNAKHELSPPGQGDWILLLDDSSRMLPDPGVH